MTWTTVAYGLLPALAIVLGGLVPLIRRPTPAWRSGIQHLAAGVVFAAAAVDVLPDIRQDLTILPFLLSFTAGVGLMLLLQAASRRLTGAPASASMLAVLGVDLLVDGFLIGVGLAAGAKLGLLLALAITGEGIAVGGATVTTLMAADWSRGQALAVMGGLAGLVPLGTFVGAFLLRGVSLATLGVVLTVGLAALLFLVTEELLTEAHEVPETPLATTMFFVGFGALTALGMALA